MDGRRLFSGSLSFAEVHPATVVTVIFLIAYPTFASDFFIFQIGAYSLILGTISLSLMMLAGYGGMVSIILEGGGRAADVFAASLEIALQAPSLGGVETLVSQPRYTSHIGQTLAERESMGIPDGFVRISLGIEDADDLIGDFEHALVRARLA